MYFNEINILDYYSVEWKSACVGVYQLLNWKMHGETLKFVNAQQAKPYNIYEGWNFNSGNYLFTTDTK